MVAANGETIGLVRAFVRDQEVPAAIVLFTVFEMGLYSFRHALPFADRLSVAGRHGLPRDVRDEFESAAQLIDEIGGLMSSRRAVIEREIPGAGNLTAAQLQGISQKSCSVLNEMGPEVQWVESYVTDDKIYCVYLAPSEELIREHAKRGGFPANRISQVRTIIDPTTAG